MRFVFLTILLGFLLFPVTAHGQVDTLDEIRAKIAVPQTRINIPGLNFSKKTDIQVYEDTTGDTYISIPFLGEYLAAIYRYSVVVIGVLAVIMLIIAGFQWMIPGNILITGSGEDKQSINQAKKRIANAITGLLLAVGSYVILYTINPELVQFRNLRVRYIARQEFDGSEATGETPVRIAERCGGAVGDTQELFSGLDGSLHSLASYSTKYGQTCKTKVKAKAIVLHYTAGGTGDTPSGIVKFWSGDTSPGTICQVIVDREGTGYQVTNSLEEKVICQGSKKGGGHNWNNGGIAIEIMGKNEQEILNNEAQKLSVTDLVSKLTARYKIPKSNNVADQISGTGGIFTHEQIVRCQGATGEKQDAGEQYAREIMKAIGGTYIDWKENPDCNK